MLPNIKHNSDTWSVQKLLTLYEAGHLNLEPGFQRQSVWTDRDRGKLIESIMRNYPLPAIFLYRRKDEAGRVIYDVIDGKQRIESMLRFTGHKKPKFATKAQLTDEDSLVPVDWTTLKRKGLQKRITGYEIPVIEVDGGISDIIEVFVRINSTGKALTAQEKRNAKYCNSPFLSAAAQMARGHETKFVEHKVFSPTHISRMKHVELTCELMLSLHHGEPLNKKTALDRVMGSGTFDGRQLGKAVKMTKRALSLMNRMFPNLRTSRFRKVNDFYSLALLIGQFESEGLILTERRRNALAWDLLSAFGSEVDKISEQKRKLQATRPEQESYLSYASTVSEGTDRIAQRRQRGRLLDGLLRSVFEKKDEQRAFSPEQRRILWNSTENRTCTAPGCRRRLTWEDFTIDHIRPHSKGGRSALDNAALMCRTCNASKGNRTRR